MSIDRFVRFVETMNVDDMKAALVHLIKDVVSEEVLYEALSEALTQEQKDECAAAWGVEG